MLPEVLLQAVRLLQPAMSEESFTEMLAAVPRVIQAAKAEVSDDNAPVVLANLSMLYLLLEMYINRERPDLAAAVEALEGFEALQQK